MHRNRTAQLNNKGAKARRSEGPTLCVFAPLLFIPFHFSVSDFSVLLRPSERTKTEKSVTEKYSLVWINALELRNPQWSLPSPKVGQSAREFQGAPLLEAPAVWERG